MYNDKGVTGRCETTLYKNKKDDYSDGILLHSKKDTKKFIHDNYD